MVSCAQDITVCHIFSMAKNLIAASMLPTSFFFSPLMYSFRSHFYINRLSFDIKMIIRFGRSRTEWDEWMPKRQSGNNERTNNNKKRTSSRTIIHVTEKRYRCFFLFSGIVAVTRTRIHISFSHKCSNLFNFFCFHLLLLVAWLILFICGGFAICFIYRACVCVCL